MSLLTTQEYYTALGRCSKVAALIVHSDKDLLQCKEAHFSLTGKDGDGDAQMYALLLGSVTHQLLFVLPYAIFGLIDKEKTEGTTKTLPPFLLFSVLLSFLSKILSFPISSSCFLAVSLYSVTRRN
jgi:hypothetical protein